MLIISNHVLYQYRHQVTSPLVTDGH